MEALNLSALHFMPRLNRPSFFRHVILDARVRTCLHRSCSDSGRMLRNHLYMCPHKRCNLVLGGNFGVGENSLPVCHGQTSRAGPYKQASSLRSLRSCQVLREESGGTLSGESILLNEQTLEQELHIAIQEENYAQAAKIRDSLRLLQEDNEASILAANAKFYKSFTNGDMAAMQALWSKGEHVCVVHPGVSGISTHDVVMGSWEFVWAEYEFPLEIEIKDVRVHVRGEVGYVTCIEMVRPKDDKWGRHFATNIFERVDGQWFICIHHSSFIDL